MANLQKVIVVGCAILADGVNSTYQIDLLRDPYFISFQGNGFGELPVDWFSENSLRNQPVGVVPVSSPDSISLSDNVVTYTYATPPSAGVVAISFGLLF